MSVATVSSEQMSNRKKIFIIWGIPIILLIGTLFWGTYKKGNVDNKPWINSEFGIVPVSVPKDHDFTVTTMDNQTLTKADFSGKVLVIDFWSSWCVPCKSEGPILAEVYDTWKDRGVEFLGVSIWDSEDAVKQFILENGIKYPNAIDKSGEITVDFGVRGIPEKFIISPKGEIIKKVIGPNSKNSLEKILDEVVLENFRSH